MSPWIPTLLLALGAGGPRTETFVLEESGPDGPVPVAVVTWRSLPGEGGLLLEQDATFRAGGVRLLHDELREGEGWRVVRRELRGPESPGRTWLAEPAPEGEDEGRLLRFGTSLPVHASYGASTVRMPLELLEDLRLGRVPEGDVPMFDPSCEAIVLVRVRRFEGDVRSLASAPQGARTFELRREDGSLVGRYVFHAARLVAFQWQDGARWARVEDPRNVRRFERDWAVAEDRMEAVWSAVRAGRVLRR